jgi:NADPH-dependent curcumin reductase CurA
VPNSLKKPATGIPKAHNTHHAELAIGLKNIHEAINSLVVGRNIGKQLCQVAADPTS